MRSLVDNIIILLLVVPLAFGAVFFPGTGAAQEAAQEVQESPGPATIEAEPAKEAPQKVAAEPGKTRKAPVREERKTAARTDAPEPARGNADTGRAGGVLDIQDGDFLYRRIPEKKFPETSQSGLEGFDTDASIRPAGEELPDMSQRKGLFGMSAESTNYVAKGMLLFIIVVIFVLYRLRSRTRRSTVHKSFR
jgi:hypothetical protein